MVNVLKIAPLSVHLMITARYVNIVAVLTKILPASVRSLVLVKRANLIVTVQIANIVAIKNVQEVVLANLAPKTVTVDSENLVVAVTQLRTVRAPVHVLGICVQTVAIVGLERFVVEMM